jgi:hypothetical protein
MKPSASDVDPGRSLFRAPDEWRLEAISVYYDQRSSQPQIDLIRSFLSEA